MTPEEIARKQIDEKLVQSGWLIQDYSNKNPTASLGVAIREYPTSTGPVDYALFVDRLLVGIIEAKKDDLGESLSSVEVQSNRYANSRFKYVQNGSVRFVYEATGEITRFTDYNDKSYRSREIFSFHRPESLKALLEAKDTIRNNLKHLPELDTDGFRDCQILALNNLDKSFAENRPKALIQMATGAGKTFTAITASYRLLKYGKMKRILFLVDTKSLGEQAESSFRAYKPNDDNRSFSELYAVSRLTSSRIPQDIQVCVSTIQRMYSILKGEELDDSSEETSLFEQNSLQNMPVKEVVYNEKYPPEFFDCIIIDECHRSIYNVWKQVLEYFDSFIIGLTATPDKRTLGFFNQNIVSEYSREQAIIDGVNVGEDIFLIETSIAKEGATILKQLVEYRNRLTRAKRWKNLEDDFTYKANQLDRAVINPSQIRTVIQAFKDSLYTKLFPRRKEVPKTLIFAKTDSHADDIIQIVRDVFGEGNEFCQKITCKADNPEAILSSFRNDYYPRIAVTVDMIATGVDVKPIECLLFMRDVRSKNYFEQMKGRGTRTLSKEDLQKVTPSALENKDRFIIVDAVGVTQSEKTETRCLERKPSVKLVDLMNSVAMGAKDEDTLTTLANRIIRLNAVMTNDERKDFQKTIGLPATSLAQNMLDAFDEDVIKNKSNEILIDSDNNGSQNRHCEPLEEAWQSINNENTAKQSFADGTAEEKSLFKEAQQELIENAVTPFYKPENREFIENIKKSHEQIIDNVNIDTVIFADYGEVKKENAEKMIQTFKEFINENIDEITALGIVYNEKYKS